MNRCRCPLSFSFYAVNCFYAVLGIVLICFGATLSDNSKSTPPQLDEGDVLASVVVIAVGLAAILTAVFGCVAAYLEGRKLLMGYATVIVLLMVIQLILISVSAKAVGGRHTQALKQAFNELWDQNIPANGTLSRYEEWLHCCGKNSAQDYLLLDKNPTSSCCKDHDCSNIYNLFVVGCEEKFNEYVEEKTSSFNWLSWLVVGVEILCSVCSCILIDNIKNRIDRDRLYS